MDNYIDDTSTLIIRTAKAKIIALATTLQGVI